VVVFTCSIPYVFDASPLANTGNLFVICYLSFMFLVEAYSCFGLCVSFGEIFWHSLAKFGFMAVVNIPFLVFLVLPLDGTLMRVNQKMICWCVGVAFEVLQSFSFFYLIKLLELGTKKTPSLNIENFAERFGLLKVIVLGELVVDFMIDFKMDYPFRLILDYVLALSLAFNMYSLYFRAEGKVFSRL
jgi:low temperature requirement protein LtrA